MRRRTSWRACVLAALAILAPARAWGQLGGPGNPAGAVGGVGSGGADYAPPANWDTPLPLYSTQPGFGGLYFSGGYAMYQWSNPLKDQLVAVRGFVDYDGSVTGGAAGTFVGSRNNALDVHQVTGPSSWQPGFTIEGGWKFQDGSALTLSYMWLTQSNMTAVATLAPPNFTQRQDLANTFLTSPVFNFPAQFAGPPFKVSTGNQEALFGIWNGASAMTEWFIQRYQQLQLIYRMPFYDTECYRISGLMGPKFAWFWEKYQWRTTDLGSTTQGASPIDQPSWTATYTNIDSNRMYGADIGLAQELYVGHGFALQLNTEVAAYMDVVRERTQYALDVRDSVRNRRSRTNYTFVPEFEVTPSIMWYPVEGIQVRVGYDWALFLNTIATPRPVTFDYSGLDPARERQARFLEGFQANIAFIF